MATIDVDFDWHRAFRYELVNSKDGAAIRQTGSRLERCWPLRDDGQLYLRFARLDGSPEQCLAFARSWGFLHTLPGKDVEEDVDLWRRSIQHMRAWIETVAGSQDGSTHLARQGIRTRTRIASLDVLLSTDLPGPHRTLVFKPRSLMDAMMVQFAQGQASGAAIASCEQCGNWFETGAGGRRTVAKFCSDTCRHKFNNRQRVGK